MEGLDLTKKPTPLGTSLGSYINKSQGSCYDADFTRQLKRIRSDWFVSQSQVLNKNKNKLLQMAKSGKSRPKFSTILGKLLSEQTTKKDNKNNKFSKTIRKLRPDWFITNSQITKQKLLLMAKNGAKRPNQKTHLGMLMYSYFRRDLEFKNKIKKIRPEWFVTRSDVANMKKKKLLEMAKKGYKRTYDALGKCLCNYVSKGTGNYDPVFDKKIKKLRPDWFKK